MYHFQDVKYKSIYVAIVAIWPEPYPTSVLVRWLIFHLTLFNSLQFRHLAVFSFLASTDHKWYFYHQYIITNIYENGLVGKIITSLYWLKAQCCQHDFMNFKVFMSFCLSTCVVCAVQSQMCNITLQCTLRAHTKPHLRSVHLRTPTLPNKQQ